jgi:adenylate cyclase
MRRRRRIRIALLALVAVASVALGLVAYYGPLLPEVDLASVNARFSIRGDEGKPRDLVVVGVDDTTFSETGLRWPFPRRVHARVIDRLRADGAKVIAYDVQFTEATPGRQRYCALAGGPAQPDDCALATATRRAGNLVFSTTEVDAKGRTNVLGGDDILKFLRARAGNGNIPDDADGKDRRVPYRQQRLNGFAVVAAERASGRPVPRFGAAWIDFRGPPGTVPEVPMSHVLDGKFAPGTFRGKIVVVGAVAPTLKDVFHTSVGGSDLMSGPELQAASIDTIRRGLPLGDSSRWLDVLLIGMLGLVAPAASVGRSALRGLGIALAAGVAFAVVAQLAFDGGTILPVFPPLLALVVAIVASLAVHYFTETRERRRTRQLFARFVPENVVDEVLARTDDDLRIGGVQREGTVMFSDLRGFTSFAERLPVERVIEVLNRYLGSMSEAILDNGGTLVAYMGDGVMAVFGAPIEQPDHADRGLAAALEMRDVRLPAFNEWLRAEGLSESGFRMGIGLNSGHVMSGNVGSERRLEYTAIGDTTNTASRIEGMTKDTPHQLLLAEATRDMLNGQTGERAAFVGEFEVRGREQKIRLWTIIEEGAT